MQDIWKWYYFHNFSVNLKVFKIKKRLYLKKKKTTISFLCNSNYKVKCHSSSMDKTLKQLQLKIPRKVWVLNGENYDQTEKGMVGKKIHSSCFLNKNSEYCTHVCFVLVFPPGAVVVVA